MYRTVIPARFSDCRLGHSGRVPSDEVSQALSGFRRKDPTEALSAYGERTSDTWALALSMAGDVHSQVRQ
jgi:hypothetical protein